MTGCCSSTLYSCDSSVIVLDASCHRYYLWFKNPFFEALLCIDRIATISEHKEKGFEKQ